MDTALFDFELPPERIALRPAEPRGSGRMLVVGPDGVVEHARISDLPRYLRAGDRLVVNDTRVIAARLRGRRAARGQGPHSSPRIEIMLHKRMTSDRFLAFARPARKLEQGDVVFFGDVLSATVYSRGAGGEVELGFSLAGAALDAALALIGEVPLPPYIAGKRKADARDTADYQTIFAAVPGSVAAPTAGLHFTPHLFGKLEAGGVGRETVTLHVGAGTFLPVSVSDTSGHKMHGEWARLSAETAERLNAVHAAHGRIVAVGTTSLRTLESAADETGALGAFEGETDIFITPGYHFRAVDVLLTNFHLPRSSLFMLVCAFCGLERMRAAYREAVREAYRFYSYGDACLLFRPTLP
ncbi:MAG TPA: tRNA preQ1(34) S-adenosylmethionine ribosyltransferase-isomerase QueA [Rhizomicrobium sp.]|nr:tRNA preQ1(34) S-adenosylmethionine ribosyltransferase-isomerase QueA [Rhizomicrobium sp.]